jgi:trimeric autotransporter adhesin
MKHGRTARLTGAFLVLAMTVSVVPVLEAVTAGPAGASVPPIAPEVPGLVTSDPLPTVQIDGVVWDQHVLGNTVYVVGNFTTARPAGSPPGVNEVTRQHMLAYDLTTGQLIPGFVANLNNQATVVTSSPDGSRLYIGGLFTSVNGVTRYHLAALDPTTGAVIPGFFPYTDYGVNAIVHTPSAVYVGGSFNRAGTGGQDRSNLAAFSPTTGALLDWAPQADDRVFAMELAPDGSRLFVAGQFRNINGQQAIGVAPVDPVTGALIPWPANEVVRVGNPGNGAIYDLRISGNDVYAGGFTFGRSGGNLEGVFKADAYSGVIEWIEDCHGDTYKLFPVNGYVYKASHVHQCHNIGGQVQSSNQFTQWGEYMRHSQAYKDEVAGIIRRDQWSYDNWEGFPAPSLAHWFPDWTIGSFTGLNQATWSVEGNDDYVVFGGEFPRVNNVPQQGLVRFARRDLAPRNDGPRVSGTTFPINVESPAAGHARVSFTANFDRDNATLTYQVQRNGTVVHTTTETSTFWDRPTVSFLDSGLTPGQTYSYRVRAVDPDGNQAFSDFVPVTVAATGDLSPYAEEVLRDDPRIYWRLGDPSGSDAAKDSAGGTQTGTVNDMTFGRPGAIIGDPDTAAMPNSTSSRIVSPGLVNSSGSVERNPVYDELSVEGWFRTTSTDGGRIVGFGNNAASNSSSASHDRLLYVDSIGRVHFGVRTRPEGSGVSSTRVRRAVSSQSGLNNGQWHHVVGTLSPDGMELYVNGVRVASRADTISGHGYYGYWRVGADTVTTGSGGWPGTVSSTRLNGDIDEVAIYHRALTPTQIAKHYELSGRSPAINPAPADPYGAAVHALDPWLYYRLDEASGTVANDSGIRNHTGDYAGGSTGTTRNQDGVVAGNAAVQFNGSGSVSSRTAVHTPGAFSVEAWFNTTSTTGGKIIGFGSSRTGLSASSDRHVYLRDDGRLAFGAGGQYPAEVLSNVEVNDGEWHHVVASQGSDGMKLYVDGVLQGAHPLQVGQSYVGYWRVGGDRTPAGSTADYFTGLIDEAVVYDEVLTSAQVTQHYALVDPDGVNLPPTAEFTWSAIGLEASFDASDSSDPDGTIVSYEWDFGDGSPVGSGVMVDHTYAVGGTYTVKLTVTDDSGASTQTEKLITVNEPATNDPPVAVFDVEVSGLSIAVDGSGSSDPDGSIVSYGWDFGDGSAGASGVTANHTYAGAGTFTVKLTVTDDEGATGETTRQVTVSEPGAAVVFAADAFERVVSNGFGTADVGGAWTTSGAASNYSVSGGQGRHQMPTPGALTQSLLSSVSGGDVFATVDVAYEQVPTGGGVYTSLLVRQVGGSHYQARIRVMPGQTTLSLFRVVNGTYTGLGAVNVPGAVYQAGDVLRLQLEATGSGTTQLGAKLWKVGQAEPASWQVTASDTTPSLQDAGGVGLISYLSGAAGTTAPLVGLFDNLFVTEPNMAP